MLASRSGPSIGCRQNCSNARCSKLAGSTPAWAQTTHRCAPAAREHAHKLLAFHVGGDDRIEIAQKSYDQRYRIEIEWEPVRSKLTGKDLAATIESDIVPLRKQLASTESRIAELLA